jgi:hypothetical protein
MPNIPKTQYFISDEPAPITSQHPLWKKVLPQNRHFETVSETTLTYGAYFTAISDYLRKLGPARLTEIASQIAGNPINPEDISQLDIHLEKHGAFYHPARLILHENRVRITCVVNVAVSKLGQETIKTEFHNLIRLDRRYANKWLPQVYDYQPLTIDGQADVHMLLGEWFDEFHEFHLSKARNSEGFAIRVWDPGNPKHYLSSNQVQQIFEQAAMILTAHYRIDTTEQIAAWHNAAGDFVICVQPKNILVKLVTVRHYEPLFNLRILDDSLETILNTALIFFLNICLKLRIDRLDGVGDMVWNSLYVVPSIITGFFKGLEYQAQHHRISPELIDAIKIFLFNLPEKDVQEICTDIFARIEPHSPDLPVVRQNLETHIAAVFNGLRQLATL